MSSCLHISRSSHQVIMPSVTPNASPVTDETNTPQLQKLTIDPKTFLHEIPSINKKHPLNPYRQTQIPLTSPKPSKILDIIHRYKLTTRPGSYDLTVNGFKVLSQICARITANQHISMCLPAFPFNSPSRHKGRLPTRLCPLHYLGRACVQLPPGCAGP